MDRKSLETSLGSWCKLRHWKTQFTWEREFYLPGGIFTRFYNSPIGLVSLSGIDSVKS